MSDHTISLSPRHELFVAEYLQHGNATRAYVRAGYASRAAQTCGSRLLRDPRIEAAIAAGRQRIAESLAVSVERVTLEYAKIAFARIDDFVSSDDEGRVRIDLEKANEAQRAGLIELRVINKSKQEQSVTLKLGKLPALAALNKQLGGQAAKAKPAAADKPVIAHIAECLELGRQRNEANQRALRAERELAEARLKMTGIENPNPSIFPISREPEPQEPAPHDQPEAPEAPPLPAAMPGMPTGPLPDHRPGLYPNAKFTWSGGRQHGHGPDSADALRMMKPGGFPGW